MQIRLYVLLGLASAGLIGLGRVLEKRGLTDIPSLGEKWLSDKKKIQWGKIKDDFDKLLNSYFLTGIGLDFFGWILTLAALSIGEISIVQSLKSFASLVALLLGVLWLDEDLDRLEYIGTVLVILGVVFINMVA